MEIRVRRGDFSGGPVVKNPPFDAEDMGSVSGWGTKIPPAAGRLGPRTATAEPACHRQRAPVPQAESPRATGRESTSHDYVLQRKIPGDATRT